MIIQHDYIGINNLSKLYSNRLYGTHLAPSAAENAVITPALSEHNTISILSERLERALDGLRWVAVFVDGNTTDGTLDELVGLTRQKPYLRFIRRIGTRPRTGIY